MARIASIERKTAETNIRLQLNLDGTGQADIATYFARFFIPSLTGNVLGGFVLVTWLNHAQVTSGDGHKK